MKTIQQNPASDNQKADVAAYITGLVLRTVKFKSQAEAILSDKGGFTKRFKELLGEISFESEYITNYKKDLEKFFLEIYKITLDLSSMVFVESEAYKHYMVVPVELDADKIYEGFDKIGLPKSKYISGSIVSKKKSEQLRPEVLYGFAHFGDIEPDTEHLGKSYNDFIVESNTFLTIDEYLLIHQFMWWKFKIHLDKKGWTRTTTLDSDDDAMGGGWYGDGCKLGYVLRDDQCSDGGPRSAVLF